MNNLPILAPTSCNIFLKELKIISPVTSKEIISFRTNVAHGGAFLIQFYKNILERKLNPSESSIPSTKKRFSNVKGASRVRFLTMLRYNINIPNAAPQEMEFLKDA